MRRRPILIILAAVVVIAGWAASSARPASPAAAAQPTLLRIHDPSAAAGGASGRAMAALNRLPVKAAASMAGYSRSAFGPAWDDEVNVPDGHDHCDTRDDILTRDMTRVTYLNGHCEIASGVLHDPYTGKTIDFVRGVRTSLAVQIDHVVALGDAWQTGARQLSEGRRTELANDPLELIAVGGPANEAKGDADAASWLPPNTAFRCRYVARQVAVKTKYRLWVTAVEKRAMARVLGSCRDEQLPSEPGSLK